MKILSSLLAATMLAATIGNVYADTDNPCPDLYTIRHTGSKFTHAYNDRGGKNPDLWILTAEPFSFGGNSWQTIYSADMPGIDGPQAAVAKGQNDYNYSALMTTPRVSASGTYIGCQYSDTGNYLVYAENRNLSGLKKFM